MPCVRMESLPFPGESIRRWIAVGALAVCGTAVIAYVAAVNAMMLDGEAMRRVSAWVAVSERERALVESRLIGRQAPSALRLLAANGQMVEAEGIRYLSASQPVALSSRR